MRLIDADALKQAIEDKRCADCPDNVHGIRCAACQWDDAIAMIEDAPTIGGCISVKDRLPDEDDCYLAYGHYGWDILFYDSSEGGWLNMGYRIADGEVTHWRPLPEPPEEEYEE
jgi:hypothetical protein